MKQLTSNKKEKTISNKDYGIISEKEQ